MTPTALIHVLAILLALIATLLLLLGNILVSTSATFTLLRDLVFYTDVESG
jgi:hypothetical protein